MTTREVAIDKATEKWCRTIRDLEDKLASARRNVVALDAARAALLTATEDDEI